jgi:hypothetical protein
VGFNHERRLQEIRFGDGRGKNKEIKKEARILRFSTQANSCSIEREGNRIVAKKCRC